MFGMHYKDHFRNLKQLKKERHSFKSREKVFISLEGKKKMGSGKQISEYDLRQYRIRLQKRLRQEHKVFVIKMMIGMLIIGGLLYGLTILIF